MKYVGCIHVGMRVNIDVNVCRGVKPVYVEGYGYIPLEVKLKD